MKELFSQELKLFIILHISTQNIFKDVDFWIILPQSTNNRIPLLMSGYSDYNPAVA